MDEQQVFQKLSSWLDTVTTKKDNCRIITDKFAKYKICKRSFTALSAAYFLNFGEDLQHAIYWRQSPLCKADSCLDHRIRCSGPIRIMNVQDLTKDDRLYLTQYLEANSRVTEGGCRLWTGNVDRQGYGLLQLLNCKTAHVVSWTLANNRATKAKEVVRHKCIKQTNCIASHHLEIGSSKQNALDRKRDGTLLIGEKNPGSKYSDDTARKVWESRGTGTRAERAKKLNVSQSFVGEVDRGKRKYILSTDELEELQKRPKKRPRLRKVLPTANREQYFQQTKERLAKRVNKTIDEQGKEHWIAKITNKQGYGMMSFYRYPRPMHFVSWAIYNDYPHKSLQPNEKGEKLVIRHGCQYRSCVNPKCLRGPGTNSENQFDVAKDRPKGTLNPASKLTIEQVHAIRESKEPIRATAKKYQVSPNVITLLLEGKTYKSIPVRTPLTGANNT